MVEVEVKLQLTISWPIHLGVGQPSGPWPDFLFLFRQTVAT
jgi:hypothetical protein